jgi:tetratricopeptide (TPR) repeat protein
LEANVLFADGDLKAALAAAGEGVRLSPERPEGYLVLGDLNLAFGDLLEARRCFEAAAAKSKAALNDAAFVGASARRGLARTARLSGDVAAAAAEYAALLESTPDDPALSEATEAFLETGDVVRAKRCVRPADDATPDDHLVAAIVHVREGLFEEAATRARLAFLGNLYLLAAILDEEPPDLGLVHGIEEATADYAKDAAERLRSILAPDSPEADLFALWASTPIVSEETAAFVDAARALGAESDPARRREHSAAILKLRDVGRVRATSPQVLRQAADLDAPSEAPSQDGADPFQV